jgi:hypothetical protein
MHCDAKRRVKTQAARRGKRDARFGLVFYTHKEFHGRIPACGRTLHWKVLLLLFLVLPLSPSLSLSTLFRQRISLVKFEERGAHKSTVRLQLFILFDSQPHMRVFNVHAQRRRCSLVVPRVDNVLFCLHREKARKKLELWCMVFLKKIDTHLVNKYFVSRKRNLRFVTLFTKAHALF